MARQNSRNAEYVVRGSDLHDKLRERNTDRYPAVRPQVNGKSPNLVSAAITINYRIGNGPGENWHYLLPPGWNSGLPQFLRGDDADQKSAASAGNAAHAAAPADTEDAGHATVLDDEQAQPKRHKHDGHANDDKRSDENDGNLVVPAAAKMASSGVNFGPHIAPLLFNAEFVKERAKQHAKYDAELEQAVAAAAAKDAEKLAAWRQKQLAAAQAAPGKKGTKRKGKAPKPSNPTAPKSPPVDLNLAVKGSAADAFGADNKSANAAAFAHSETAMAADPGLAGFFETALAAFVAAMKAKGNDKRGEIVIQSSVLDADSFPNTVCMGACRGALRTGRTKPRHARAVRCPRAPHAAHARRRAAR